MNLTKDSRPVIVQEIEKTLHLIREQGITTIIVEQNAVAAFRAGRPCRDFGYGAGRV